MKRKTLTINVPEERPDPNWRGWDFESFVLRNLLIELIDSYGLSTLKSELRECETYLLRKDKL